MEKPGKSKPKKDGKSKPLQVALFKKKSPTKAATKEEEAVLSSKRKSPSKTGVEKGEGNFRSKTSKTSLNTAEKEDDGMKSDKAGPSNTTSPTLKKTPPLYSSTPKPVQMSANINIFTSISASHYEKSPHRFKRCTVLLNRLPEAETVSSKNAKEVNKNPISKPRTKAAARTNSSKEKPETETVTTKEKLLETEIVSRKEKTSAKEDFVKPKSKPRTKAERKIFPKENPPLRKSRRGVPDKSSSQVMSNASITFTSIPSEALENFGIIQRQSSPVRQVSKYGNAILSDTPPRTSTACSSHDDFIEHPATSVEDESPLPDSSVNLALLSRRNTTPSSVAETDATTAKVSSSNELDIMGIQHVLPRSQSSPNTHSDLMYGLKDRLYSTPHICPLDELHLHFSNMDIRQIAPYSLKLCDKEDKFLPFVKPISTNAGKFCCLVFGALNSYVIAYGGHFIVEKDRLYDPNKKIPVEEVKIMKNPNLCRQHMGLFHMPNSALLKMELEGYYPQANQASYHDQLNSLEIFTSSISQIQQKQKLRNNCALELVEHSDRTLPTTNNDEPFYSTLNAPGQIRHGVPSVLTAPRMEHDFYRTSLPITADSLKRICHNVSPITIVKARYGELASMQFKCTEDQEFFSPYYLAHEESGCVSFYQKAFILGYIEDHFVVGVIADKKFFIMATKRLYNRLHPLSPKMHPVCFSPEMLDMIHIPLWVPFQDALTMLETRQILYSPNKYGTEFEEISERLAISTAAELGMTPHFTVSALENERQHKIWLGEMVDYNFTRNFQDSFCQFPSDPFDCSNATLFIECIVKLWVHQLLRMMNDIEEDNFEASNIPHQIPLTEFFKMSVDTFVSKFLSSFGLSVDSTFQCLQLGPNGIPSAVCLESLPARQIGLHVQKCHTRPLSWENNPQKKFQFIPFVLNFQQNSTPPEIGSNSLFDTLRLARSMVEFWPKGSTWSYIQILEKVQRVADVATSNFPPSILSCDESGPKNKSVQGEDGVVSLRKRRHTSDEDSSFNRKRHHPN